MRTEKEIRDKIKEGEFIKLDNRKKLNWIRKNNPEMYEIKKVEIENAEKSLDKDLYALRWVLSEV